MKKDTKTVLIETAEKLIAESGYYSTKIEDITKKSGVAKGTFYTYFKSKEDILFSIFDMRGQSYEDEIRVTLEASNEIREKLIEMTKFHINFALKNKNFFLLIHKLFENSDPEMNEKLINRHLENKMKVLYYIERIILESINKNILSTELTSRALDLANIYASMRNQHIFFLLIKSKKDLLKICEKEDILIELKKVNAQREAEFIVDLFLNGVKNLK